MNKLAIGVALFNLNGADVLQDDIVFFWTIVWPLLMLAIFISLSWSIYRSREVIKYQRRVIIPYLIMTVLFGGFFLSPIPPNSELIMLSWYLICGVLSALVFLYFAIKTFLLLGIDYKMRFNDRHRRRTPKNIWEMSPYEKLFISSEGVARQEPDEAERVNTSQTLAEMR